LDWGVAADAGIGYEDIQVQLTRRYELCNGINAFLRSNIASEPVLVVLATCGREVAGGDTQFEAPAIQISRVD
jgi:hypothetical protein